MKYEYKATALIAKEFDAKHVRYRVYNTDSYEEIDCSFPVDEGPIVHVCFISRDNDMDVSVRIHALINDVPSEKHQRLLQTCNELNNSFRFVKFVLSDDDVNVEYDFPVHISEECVGAVAFEIFRRLMSIVDRSWPRLMKALFTSANAAGEDDGEDEEEDEHPMLRRMRNILRNEGVHLSGQETPAELLEKLKELRQQLEDRERNDSEEEEDE